MVPYRCDWLDENIKNDIMDTMKRRYRIIYFNETVQQDLEAWPMRLRVRYQHLTDRMKVHGGNLGEPHTKAFEDGLIEMRIKGKEGIGRVFYFSVIGFRIVMLHSFIKKSEKTPLKERRIAEKRMKAYKEGIK